MIHKHSARIALGSAIALALSPWTLIESAHAQCCWGSKPQAAYPVGSPYPVASPYPAQGANYAVGRPTIPVVPITPSYGSTPSYYGNYGMLPPASGNALPNGFPQSVASAMPTAAYDTQWQRTPVTYYRPVTQFDPNYGTTVTSLQPCTSYQYQAQRVPMVAPTPVGGAYAQASNQWPAINQPGYYPTGVANAYAMNPVPLANPNTPLPGSMVAPPTYPQVQYLPSNGTVPASATSTGSATFQANTNPGLSSAVYYGSPTANPAVNCPNGVCPSNTYAANAPSTNLTPPNVPGAASIVPMGPVTYLPGSSVPGSSVPGSSNTNPVLPPSGATLDPEAARAPTWPPPPSVTPPSVTPPSATPTTSSAGLWSDRDERVAKMSPMTRLPMVPIDRPVANAAPTYPTSRSVSNDPAAIASPFPGSFPSNPATSPTLPTYQPSTKTLNAKPLVAPEGFDGKPHWNPKLLPPSASPVEDKVAQLSTASLK
ncbi:MAG: hypothetical protein LW720_11830 [Pirellula sp.]|nr:hypothetical protein [Pirellula sp.]